MDDNHRELLRRLFAAATELTETAHEAATAGQSEALTAGDYATAARRLRGAAGGGAGHRRPGRGSQGHRRPERRRFLGQPRLNAPKQLDLRGKASVDGW